MSESCTDRTPDATQTVHPPATLLPWNGRIHSATCKQEGDTVRKLTWLLAVCVCPVAALAFSIAICGALVVSLTTELHQQLWHSK